VPNGLTIMNLGKFRDRACNHRAAQVQMARRVCDPVTVCGIDRAEAEVGFETVLADMLDVMVEEEKSLRRGGPCADRCWRLLSSRGGATN
jgi:hypothetical protein